MSKKIVVGFVSVMLIAGLFGFGAANYASAQGLTLAQLVEFFIGLKVIAPDKVNLARAYVASQTGTTNSATKENTTIINTNDTNSVTSVPRPVTSTVPISDNQPCYNFSKDLGINASGSDVAALQSRLISKGYDIPAISSGRTHIGYFGSQTAEALKKYQQNIGVPATGILGSSLRQGLSSSANCISPSVPVPSTPANPPTQTCMQKPACLSSTPRCMIPEPASGWCQQTASTPVISGVSSGQTAQTSSSVNVGNVGNVTQCEYAAPPVGYHWEGGQPYPVCGGHLVTDTTTSPIDTPSIDKTYHPADTNKDLRITISEVTTYGNGTYATSASNIWRNGETYRWDSATQDWIPTTIDKTYHPADTNKDLRITIDEVTTYGNGTYATSASNIWRSGETYRWDSATQNWIPN